MDDPRAREGLEHLQAGALELIAAARALLDVAERLVRDPTAAATVVATVSSVARTMVLGPEAAGEPTGDGLPRAAGTRDGGGVAADASAGAGAAGAGAAGDGAVGGAAGAGAAGDGAAGGAAGDRATGPGTAGAGAVGGAAGDGASRGATAGRSGDGRRRPVNGRGGGVQRIRVS